VFVISFVYLVRMRVYLHDLDNRLAQALAGCNVLNSALAIYLWQQRGSKESQHVAITAVFVGLNVGIPGVLAGVMLYQQWKRSREESSEGRERGSPPSFNGNGTVPTTSLSRPPPPPIPRSPYFQGSSHLPLEELENSSVADLEASYNINVSRILSETFSVLGAGEADAGDSGVRADDGHHHGDLPHSPDASFSAREPPAREGSPTGSAGGGGSRRAGINPIKIDGGTTGVARREHALARIAAEILKQKQHVWDKNTGDKYLGGYFMLVGTCCVLALGACVVGSLRMQPLQYLVSTDPLYQRRSVVLADYTDWDEMTSNCCCLQTAHPSESFSVQERWACKNSRVIERGRLSADGSDDGRFLRAVCAVDPVYSKCFITTSSSGKPYMECTSEQKSALVPTNMTDYAYTYLW
jgi:hypothetical protein